MTEKFFSALNAQREFVDYCNREVTFENTIDRLSEIADDRIQEAADEYGCDFYRMFQMIEAKL